MNAVLAPMYTQLAGRAVELSTLFTLFVGSRPIPTAGGVFAIELMTPHGPSTGGGAQALQHIRFVHGDLTIVVGSVDQIAAAIELRSYDCIAERYARRWKQPLPFARADYDAFVTRVRAFGKSQQYALVLVELAQAPAPDASLWWLPVAVLAAVAPVAGALAMALL